MVWSPKVLFQPSHLHSTSGSVPVTKRDFFPHFVKQKKTTTMKASVATHKGGLTVLCGCMAKGCRTPEGPRGSFSII